MDFESVARELKMLARKGRLTASELDRAKGLMVQLKGMGMSNPEIAELTGDRWSESAVKGYTRGVRATDPEPWQSATALFSELLSKNLTLADVSKAVSITTELEGMGSSLGEIAGFIAELEGEGIDVKAFALLLGDWHEAGLTSADARSALSYKSQLEQAGFDIDTLSHVAEAAGKFGGSGGVLEAVARYGNLEELDQEAQKRQEGLDAQAAEMESCRQKIDTADKKLEELRNEIAAKEKALATYEGLRAIGFDEQGLGELAKAAEKYGTPHEVLRAVNLFGNLTKIKATDDELRKKVNQKRGMIKSLDKQYSHLREPIEMCKRLLKRKFGLSVLSQVNAMASRYGEPTEVMKAIEAYGALVEIEKETNQARAKLAEIEGKVQALKETYNEQNARNRAILNQLEALNAKAIEVGRTVGSVEQQLKGNTMAHDLLALLQNPTSASYQDSLPLVLVLLKCITVWATMHESKVPYPSLVSTKLEELLGYLGGS
jgi:predicted  nucleic acid-binding Zn-ribbon protein